MNTVIRYIDGYKVDSMPPGFKIAEKGDIVLPSGNGWQQKAMSFQPESGSSHEYVISRHMSIKADLESALQ